MIATESDDHLASSANYAIRNLGIDNVIVISEPLAKGHPDCAPYDVIIINGTVGHIPTKLSAQLGDNGRLVTSVPVKGRLDHITVMRKINGELVSEIIMEATIPPLEEFTL